MDGSQTFLSFQGLTNKSSQTVLNPHLLKCTALKRCFTRRIFSFPFFSGVSSILDCGGSFKLDQIYDTGHHRTGGQKLVDKIYDIGAGVTPGEDSDVRPEPGYIRGHSGNVTAILGKTAILNCRVTGVGNRSEEQS